MKVFENLYAYVWQGNDNNCNSYLLSGVLSNDKHVLIDPGHNLTPYYQERGLDRLFEAIDRDGVSSASIGLVILTHGHPDHCEGAMAIREGFSAPVAIHEADEPAYKEMGGKADFFLQEGTLELGSIAVTSLQVLHSPGHTPGHVAIYWPDRKVLMAGDCVFYRSTGRADLPGGSASQLRQTINRLAQLDIEYLLCGHAYGNPGIMKGKRGIQENFHYIQGLI